MLGAPTEGQRPEVGVDKPLPKGNPEDFSVVGMEEGKFILAIFSVTGMILVWQE